MTKLLNKPLKTFIVFTCVVLACSIPAYFYLIESIWIDELDDHNQQLKEQIQKRFNEGNPDDLNKRIELWNQIQINSQISSASGICKDSVYLIEKEIVDKGVVERERFRGLFSVIFLNGKTYSVTIETNVEEVNETVLAISIITCLFIVFLIIGFILLNRKLSRQIWAPFTDTLEKLKQFDLNNADVINLKNTDIKEFVELNETLIKLINDNVSVYKQQKEFTQNASHELQTPLAILKSKVDLLIQDASLTADQRKIIESLDASISRVTRINKNLLLLSGIENKQFETEEVNLSEQVKSVVNNFIDFAEEKGRAISLSVQDGIMVNANESLVEILISNLISNAVRHGGANSGIDISLNGQGLIISNEGKATLNEDNLFRRFISATTHNPGTGLGLAIVKEICDKYRWRVSYTFTGNQHVFSVFF